MASVPADFSATRSTGSILSRLLAGVGEMPTPLPVADGAYMVWQVRTYSVLKQG